MRTITVFKTSVSTPKEVAKLRSSLNRLFENDERWNFDLEDRENILRVESAAHKANQVINVLNTSGYQCIALED
jgi:hypothetical protein